MGGGSTRSSQRPVGGLGAAGLHRWGGTRPPVRCISRSRGKEPEISPEGRPRQLDRAAAAEHLRQGKRAVVEQNRTRHTTEEGEDRDVAVAEGLRRLGRVGLDGERIRARNRHCRRTNGSLNLDHREAVQFAPNTTDLAERLAEVNLRVPGRMRQGYDHVLDPARLLANAVGAPVSPLVKPCSSRNLSKIRRAVRRRFFGKARPASSIRSIIGRNGSGIVRTGSFERRYSDGTGCLRYP